MSTCINKNTAEFQTLVKQSGLPEFYVSAVCGQFLEKYDRFPYLDEIQGANSTSYLNEQLNLKDGATSINKILSMTGKDNLVDAQISLNNTFRDVEVKTLQLTNDALVRITKRPITQPVGDSVNHYPYANHQLIYENVIGKLQNLYGVDINITSNAEVPDSQLAGFSTFIHNGQLYVNPSHLSMKNIIPMALLLSEVRKSDLYQQLIGEVVRTDHYKGLLRRQPKRNTQDLAEEALIEQLNRLARFGYSEIRLPENVRYELFYGIKRTMDTILMGESSVKDFSDQTLFNSSLKELCQLVNSSLDVVSFTGTNFIDEEFEQIQAKDNNVKEYCNV